MDSDDEIELLNQPQSQDSDTQQSDNNNRHLASVNPGFVLQSNSPLRGAQPQTSLEEPSSIDPGSVHALQTAFTSLQKQHNEQSKRYKELMQRHRLIQKQFGVSEDRTMDPVLANNAAGASQEDDVATAEIRAKQGYIQHLERELLRSNNNLTKGNEEIERLKKQVGNLDRIRQELIYEREKLESDLREMSANLLSAKTEFIDRDSRIQELEEAVHTTNIRNDALQDEVNDLKEQLGNADIAAQNLHSKESEIHELTSKLRSSEHERQSLTTRIRDMEKKLSEKSREISALEAKHKQYVIENDINRAQVQEQKVNDGLDDVDGEMEMIEKAYNMIREQTKSIQEMRLKADQQRNCITELYKTKESKGSLNVPISIKAEEIKMEDREDAQGASFHPEMEEKPRSPVYMNMSPRQNQQGLAVSNVSNLPTRGQQVSPNFVLPNSVSPNFVPPNSVSPNPVSPKSSMIRQSSDRRDYRGNISNQLSPRINDVAIKPTGNTHVPRMIASEQSPPLVMIHGSNVIDAQRGGSPRGSSPGGASPRGQAGSHTDVHRQTGQVTSYHNSPANNRASSPDNDQTGVVDVNVANFGARPRTHINNVSQSSFAQSNIHSPVSRLPDRMTQSEIIVRGGSSPSNQTNTAYQPVQPLEVPTLMSRSYENVYVQGQTQGNKDKTTQPRYANQANYENVFEAQRATESPNNDFDHSIYVNDPSLLMRNRTAVEHTSPSQPREESNSSVSALKICPVCNQEFSRLTMDQFQTHVFECFDNCEESPATLQPQGNIDQSEEDRTCPMCGDTFPLSIPQETYEQHVLAHFGEEPLMDRYEIINRDS